MSQEFDALADRWIDIANALDQFGAVFIHRAYDLATIDALLAETRKIYAERDLLYANNRLALNKHTLHAEFRAIGIADVTLDGAPSEQLLSPPLVTAIATLALRKAPRIEFSSFRCARANVDSLVLPYHQDSRIIARLAPHLGDDPPLVNVWAPLEDCDGTRPGLEIVNRKIGELAPVIESDQNFYAGIGTEIAVETVQRYASPEQLWRPRCKAGDLLLFKGEMIHRTHATPDMTAERISADIRLL